MLTLASYRRAHRGRRWLLAGAVMGAPAVALAQSAPTEAGDTLSGGEPPEVVVTGRRWDEARETYPGSVNVYQRRDLVESNTRTVQELTDLAPNAFMRRSNVDTTIVIRGLASYPTALYSPATLFVDEVALPAAFMHDTSLYDVERVELLHGPQSTLFGRNTASGAVHLVTRAPTPEWRARAQAEYAAYLPEGRHAPGAIMEADLGGPLVKDPWSFSVAARGELSRGYMRDENRDDNDAGKLKRANFNAKLRYAAAPFDIQLSLHGLAYRDGKEYLRFRAGPARTPRHEVAYDTRSTQRETGWVAALRARYEDASIEAQSLTSAVFYSRKFKLDFDSTPLPAGASRFDFDTASFSQDLRLGSAPKNKRFRWLGGVYAVYERGNPIFDLSRVPMIGASRDTETRLYGIAGYGLVGYRPIEPLEVSGGLRVERQKLTGEQTFATPMGSRQLDADLSYTVVLPNASISYGTDRVRPYAAVARGFLAGGYNYNFAVSDETLTFAPELTWNYELGVKSRLAEGRLFMSLALFYIDVQDKQVAEIVPGGAQRISNAASAHSLGGELEVEARPIHGLRLYGTLGYNRAEFDSFETAVPDMTGQLLPVDYSGNTLIYAPALSYAALARYFITSELWASIGWTGVSRFYFEAANQLRQGGYGLLGASVGFEKGAFAAAAWVANALDQDYAQFATLVQGQSLVQDGPPRAFGARVSYRFGATP